MNPEHWQKVRLICEDALECEAAKREDFLLRACAGDEVLLKEVESYLACGTTENGLLESPALEIAAKAMAKDDARRGEPDLSGQTLAHYRISGKIGQGGMGAVYRALDTKLRREVAIKVLPAPFADDPDRMSRFAREAKVLASLNHPHIAQIYGIEDRALVMELVPGGSLPLPLPIKDALHYAKQIAEALESAHEKGIVHRDLKPANIMVTPEGQVKLLDFGLAAIARESPARDQMSVTTTELGLILGTAAYMSPEQAAGKHVDKRSDIWSFGVVLWEMLTGRRLFKGETITHTMAEVLNGPIDFQNLPRETPASTRGLLRRCLERNPKNRLRDIGEARIAIEAALSGEPQSAELAAAPGGGPRLWLAWGVALALAVSLGPFVFLHLHEKLPAAMKPVRFQFQWPESGMQMPVLAPDGRKVAFLSRDDRLWVHSLESGESHEITPTGGGVAFWSPDSRYIGYPYQGKIRRIEANGGMPQTVTALSEPFVWGGCAWNQEDTIICAGRQTGVFRVPAAGGNPVQLTTLDASHHENSQYMPSFLPDGRHFLYLRSFTDEGKTAVYIGSVDSKPEQQSDKPLVAANSQPAYAPTADPDTGYLLFVQETTLMAQPFDNRRLELKGQATAVGEQVRNSSILGAVFVPFSVSANGVLMFPQISQQVPMGQQFTWYNRDGTALTTIGERIILQGVSTPWETFCELSQDRTRLALTRLGRGADEGNIWLMDLARGGTLTRFTFGALMDLNPVWAPDGSRIVFSSNRDGQFDLYEKPANGASEERVLLKSGEPKQPTSWSRDGRILLYTVTDPKRKSDIWALPLDEGAKPVAFAATEFNEHMGRFSPDGRWVAYVSDESGQEEVYVRSFAMNAARTAVEAGGKWPVSYGGGWMPLWREDGREIYYLSDDMKLKAVEITAAPAFRAGSPKDLAVPIGSPAWTTADGRRFLVGVAAQSAPRPFVVELNWPASIGEQSPRR